MKVTLKKSNVSGTRFLGFSQNANPNEVEFSFKLLDELVKINTFQLLSSKFYYKVELLDNSLIFKGPYLNVIGPKVRLPDYLEVLDSRDCLYYESILSENLSDLSKLDQFFPQINAIRNKIGESLIYLSIDFNKIELHLFKK